MANDPHEQHKKTPRPDTDPVPRRQDTGGVEAEAVDHLKRHDPSAPSRAASRGRRLPTGEVAWVRLSDVMTHRSGRVAGRGITWTATVNRWPRLAPLRTAGTGRRAIARASADPRARRLAPLSAFGTRRTPATARSGVSL